MRNIGWLAAAACIAAAPATAAPLEAYGRLPMIESAEISPDGQMLALSVTEGEHRNVLVRRASEPTPILMLGAGSAKLRAVAWAGTGHLLITATVTTTIFNVIAPLAEYGATSDYDIAQRRSSGLFRDTTQHALNTTVLGPYVVTRDGHPTAVVGGIEFVANQGRLSLFRTALDSRRTEIIESGSRDTRDWAVNANGDAVASLEVTDTGQWSVRLRSPGHSWRAAAPGPDYERPPTLLGLGRDGSSVVVAGFEGEAQRLREVSLESGAWSEPLNPEGSASPIFDPRTFRLVGLSRLVGDTYTRTYFDPQDQARWNGAVAAFPGERLRGLSVSDDHNRAVALVDSPTDGPAYALIDFAAHHATWIGAEYRGIGAGDVAPVSYITYHAADGLEIGAYLTLPRGRDPHHLPLIVLPHGGPESRDTGGFDWWAQALASRGYAVLQPNFRGSSGYGVAFIHAGFGQWGRRMQSDLSDGIRYLDQAGTIDAHRVCIVGASYGGYAALAGVTLQHGVYRCAASVGGVSDPGGLIAYARLNHGALSQQYWDLFMGVTGPRDPHLAEISPLAQAAQADAPILLVHGRDDTVVPFAQSTAMQAALQRAHHPVQLVDLRNEDHWLSRSATRLQMLTEVVRFLEANNPPDPAPQLAPQAASPH